jgi:ketosteroid isomerase-like protein
MMNITTLLAATLFLSSPLTSPSTHLNDATFTGQSAINRVSPGDTSINAKDGNSTGFSFDKSDALKIGQEWASLVGNGNVTGLEKLLSDNYMHIHATALVESKSQFVDALRNGSRKYDPIIFEEVTVRVFGTTAIVTGEFNLKVFVRGKTIEGVNRFSLVLMKTSNGHHIVSFQATPVLQAK